MTTIDDLEAQYPGLSEKIKSPVQMSDANEEIVIYDGRYELVVNGKQIEIDGSVRFLWLPVMHAKFSGDLSKDLNLDITFDAEIEVFINGLLFGKTVNISTFRSDSAYTIEGKCYRAVFGDKTVPVTKVRFAIANMREYLGTPVKEVTATTFERSMSRMTFENDNYIIVVDQLGEHKKLRMMLETKGGYFILYAGEINKKHGSIIYNDLTDLRHSFNQFLYFLNGRRTSMLFQTGEHDDEKHWTDYTSYFVDRHKYVQSWSESMNISGYNEMWAVFSKLWKDINDQNFLETVIHWYIEANSQSAYVEGSIILAQTALELIYNWYLVERKKIITGNSAEKISASNKIRLLINQMQVSSDIPPSFTALSNVMTTLPNIQDISDGPEAFVLIRNALVHGQKKSLTLMSIPIEAKFQALQLGIWYIELSLLFIFEFKGVYNNRTSGNKWASLGEPMPWSK